MEDPEFISFHEAALAAKEVQGAASRPEREWQIIKAGFRRLIGWGVAIASVGSVVALSVMSDLGKIIRSDEYFTVRACVPDATASEDCLPQSGVPVFLRGQDGVILEEDITNWLGYAYLRPPDETFTIDSYGFSRRVEQQGSIPDSATIVAHRAQPFCLMDVAEVSPNDAMARFAPCGDPEIVLDTSFAGELKKILGMIE